MTSFTYNIDNSMSLILVNGIHSHAHTKRLNTEKLPDYSIIIGMVM